MNWRPTLVLSLAVLSCTGRDASSSAVTGATAVTVNGQAISELEVELQLHGGAHSPSGPDAKRQVTEALVQQELAAQRARELKLQPAAEAQKELDRLEAQLANGRRRALANAWYAQQSAAAATVSTEEASAWLAAHQLELAQTFHILMVMKRSRAELDALAQQLQAGAAFEELAKAQFAGAPGTPWDLGFMGFAQLPQEWRGVLASLKPGEVSPVVVGEHDRFWLLQLVEVKQGPTPTLEAAMPVITQVLTVERLNALRTKLDQSLTAGARVEYPRAP
jgi:parvulin-like peptidyl-prolyl isomerase